jgi:phosphohistidine swiveling domain-containing protein
MKSIMEAITLNDRDMREHFWTQDALHFGHPLTPLFASYMVPAITAGTLSAMTTLRAPVQQFIGKVYDGYFYQAVVPAPGDPEEQMRIHQQTLHALMDHQNERFQATVVRQILPLYAEIDAMSQRTLTPEDAAKGLKRLEAIYRELWELHFLVVLPRGAVSAVFEEVYHEAFPDRDPAEVYALVLGTMNKSLETDRGLWQLAQLAKDNREVADCFQAPDIWACLLATRNGQPFLDALQTFLDNYGWRSVTSHEFVEPTWREDPRHALAVVKSFMDNGFDFDARLAQVQQDRERKVQEVLSQIDDPLLKQKFLDVHAMTLQAWAIDEDHHFYIDAMLPAKCRPFLKQVGALLTTEGHLTTPDDIFFCYLDEVLDALDTATPAKVLSALAAQRRQEYERQKTTKPQATFGTPPERRPQDPMMTRIFGEGAPSVEGSTRVVRGFGASPGVYRGRARVIHSPQDFAMVAPGEILVCRTTTPAWTALFGVVGAVVTDTGGILSHAATVAREYAIPCVVGTRIATARFRDGDQLVVDGSEGTVLAHG